MDNVAEYILELDRGEGFPFKGNYSGFLEKKMARLELDAKIDNKRKNSLKKELEVHDDDDEDAFGGTPLSTIQQLFRFVFYFTTRSSSATGLFEAVTLQRSSLALRHRRDCCGREILLCCQTPKCHVVIFRPRTSAPPCIFHATPRTPADPI